MNSQDKVKIQSLPGNRNCIDCDTSNPTWASVTNGTLHCFECIGKHRGLGVHISFARSLDLDSWDEKQLKFLYTGGGNDNFRSFLMNKDSGGSSIEGDDHGHSSNNVESRRDNIRNVYDSEVARLYRAILKAKVEGKPEPTMQDLKAASGKPAGSSLSSNPSKITAPTDTAKPTLSLHLLKSSLPTPKERFMAGLRYYTYKYITTTIKSNYLATISTSIIYLTSKFISSSNKISLSINTIFRYIFVSSTTSLFLLSLSSIHWFLKHRHESFKSCTNYFLSRLNEGRIKRNTASYDIYFPKNASIGSTISKAMIFYPESLVDITSYAKIMSKLSDAGVLVIVMNFNPTRVVSPYHTNGSLNDCFQVVYQIEKLMGMNVSEWVLGGHGDGGNVVLDLQHRLFQSKNKTKKDRNEQMRCILWGMTTTPITLSKSVYRSSTNNNDGSKKDILCITASNDMIAGDLRFEMNITEKFLNSAEIFDIEGGNHSAFGHYGPQTFPRTDGLCVKTIDLQQKECFMRTLDFIFEREPATNKKD